MYSRGKGTRNYNVQLRLFFFWGGGGGKDMGENYCETQKTVNT